jgi:two-component system OmpR family response regulator
VRETPRLLVVEDELNVRELVALAFRFEGFDVAEAASASEAQDALDSGPFDLIVLDVMLPDADGFAFCRRFRARGHQTPVVFLTARGAVEDRLLGFNAGGDDYVAKPFRIEELVARVRAVLRRSGHPTTRMSFEDLVLDEETREVWRAGRPVELTPTEFSLLRLFMRNPRRVLSKDVILDRVWEYDFGGDAGIVETYVSRLRRKLGEPPFVETVRGVGYRLGSRG